MPSPRTLLLWTAVTGCALPKGRPAVRDARPSVGSSDDQAAPGQTACEAATRDWPELPAVDRVVAQQMERAHLPGLAACIVKDGDVAWCGAYGSTRLSGGQPVTTDTPFLWASVSKLVTATAAGVLVESGQLDWDTPASVGATAVVHPEAPEAPLTVEALLAHVAGVDDNDAVMDTYVTADQEPAYSLAEVGARYFLPDGADYSARHSFHGAGPERRFRYSNMGYALAGLAVEQAAGEELAAWSSAHIFDALGMAHTSWRYSDFDPDQLAEPVARMGGESVPQGHTTFADYPNGGLRSSAHDMACFLAMAARGGDLYGTRLLETTTLHHMMAPAFPSLDADQGLGWGYEDLGDAKPWIGHSGAELGVAADAFLRQNGRLGFVLVTNGDWGNTDAILTIEDELVFAAAEL